MSTAIKERRSWLPGAAIVLGAMLVSSIGGTSAGAATVDGSTASLFGSAPICRVADPAGSGSGSGFGELFASAIATAPTDGCSCPTSSVPADPENPDEILITSQGPTTDTETISAGSGPVRAAEKAAEDPKGVAAITWTVDDKISGWGDPKTDPEGRENNRWGLTEPQRTTLAITAFCKGEEWRSVVSTANGLVHTNSRLLPSNPKATPEKPAVKELTQAMVNAENNCGELAKMRASLEAVAAGGADQGYYVLAAVQAHESLHVTHFRDGVPDTEKDGKTVKGWTGVNAAFATFKAAVEGLTIPKADAKDAAEAATKIRALKGYTDALAAFRAVETTAAANTAAHMPAGAFPAVELSVVQPRINDIEARRTALKCP